MLINLARGKVVLVAAPSGSVNDGGWVDAFKNAGLPSPDASGVSFSDQKVNFAWRNHFIAACVAPLSDVARQEAKAKGWTLFELPGTVTAGVPEAMISTFKG
jgi:hypothetical protein